MTRRQLGNALAVALFASPGEDGGYDLDKAGEVFAMAIEKVERLESPTPAPIRRAVKAPSDRRWIAVLDRIAMAHGLSVAEVRSPARSRHVVAARTHAVYELRRLEPPMSYREISRAVGMRDHSTALAAFRRYAAAIARTSAKAA